MELVRWFAELQGADVALAGGKGAQLGELARAGLPVPPGFVLLTPAYRAFVAAAGLQPEIERLAAQARPEDAASVEAASQAIRTRFDQGAVPPEVVAAVTAAYAELGGGPVAVRSSATAEDLPGASFAGQQETYLNIAGPAAVLAAVQRCWSSLWTPRAISYRARQGIAPGEVALAVVVQRLVAADAAGVLFTANPVNNRRDQMVIDGAWGLGEAVVSGQVTPDHWAADGATGAVLAARVARKEVMTARTPDGTATVPVPPERQEQPVLDAAQVAALVALGRQAAAHLGSPQDIEWVLAGGELYVVQSRPVTSLFPLPAPAPPPELGFRVYLCVNYLQGIQEPFTPMGIDTFRHFGRAVANLAGAGLAPDVNPPYFKTAAGRIYVDVTGALQHPKTRVAILTMPTMVDQPAAAALRALAERDPRLGVVPGRRFPVHPRPGLVLTLAWRALCALAAPNWSRERRLAAARAGLADLAARAAAVGGVAARRRFVAKNLPRVLPALIFNVVPVLAVGMAARFMAEALLRKWLGDATGLQPVLRALPHNPTTQMDLELWRLSRTLKAEGAEPAAGHPAVQAFLAQYGHRTVREIDLGMPRWWDDPAHVLNILHTYLSHAEGDDPEAHFRAQADAAERAVDDLVARVRREQGALRAWLLRLLLRRTRQLAGIREYPKFFAILGIAINRRVLAGAGTELVAAGRLERADDVFFLELADLESGADLRTKAAANRAEYERELHRRAVPRLVTSEGETIFRAPPPVAGALPGTPASAGVYEGRARVILDPRGARLEPGEVLVAPGTDPAWTPLFLSAGALVMEIGGPMSHGSVVAREYGIPAVVGVAGATTRLRTGQRVRVDGESGFVLPLDGG